MLAAAAVIGASASPAAAACSLSLVVTPCIEMTVPSSAHLGTLDAGTTGTSAEQAVSVSSNQSWGLKVASDAVDGRMREWTGSAYATAGATLTHPLQWALSSLGGLPQTPSWSDAGSTGQIVVSNRAATACVLGGLCGTETVGLTYRQVIAFTDRRTAPNSYRVRLTYTAEHGF